MTPAIREWDRRTGSALRRAVWGQNPALIVACGAVGAIATWVLAVIYMGLFCK